MADFTSRQPLTDGTNRIIDDPATPSVIPGILGLATGALDSYSKYKDDQTARKAREKKEADEKRTRDAQAGVMGAIYGARDDAARVPADPAVSTTDDINGFSINPVPPTPEFSISGTAGEVFGEELAADPALTKKAQSAGEEVMRVASAVEQGRMPPISLKAALGGRVRALFDQYPDRVEEILDILGKTPAKDIIFSEMGDVVADIENQRSLRKSEGEATQKYDQSMFEAGMKALGDTAAIAGANGGPMARHEIIAEGIRATTLDYQLTKTEQQSRIALSVANLTAEQVKAQQTETSDEIERIISGDVYNDSAPLIRIAQQVAGGLASDVTGQFAQRWEQLGPLANSRAQSWVEHAVTLAQQKGYKGDVGTLRNNLMAKFKPMLDLFSGDKSVFESNHRALQTLQDKVGINVQQALPVFTALKAAGLAPNEMPGLIEGVSRNPELQKQLRDEVKGFIPEWGRERASTRLMNIVKILRGEATLRQLSPAEARAQMPVLYNTALSHSKDYFRGLGVNPDTVLNSVGEITLATRTLSPSSGVSANALAASGIGDGNVVRSLVKMTNDGGADKEMVTSTISAVRAGHATILNNFQAQRGKLNQSLGQYYEVKWNNQTGEFFIDDSKKRAALAAAQRGGAPTRMTGEDAKFARLGGSLAAGNIANAAIPKDMDRFVRGANLSLRAIIDLAPHDPTAPKATPLEMRRFYGANIMPKSMQDEPRAPSSTQTKDMDKLFTSLEKGIEGIKPDPVDVPAARTNTGGPGSRSVTGVKGQTVSVPAIAEITKSFGSNPNLSTVQREAQARGIPPELATRLAYVENKFRHGNTNSAGASGVMQVRGYNPKTGEPVHDTEALRRFGRRVRDLTAEENIQLGMDILKRNYDATGSWQKAVERYLGNGNDGNLTTAQYASLII